MIADIEIEDEKINYYSSVIIRQQFNSHHEFAIYIRYDVLERMGTFNLTSAQKKIGKLAVIKLIKTDSLEQAYEFRGLICEITMEQSGNFTSNLVLKGYSPTILLENGPHLSSFYDKSLSQIVQQLTNTLSQSCRVNISPQHQQQIRYICQYRESAFHFLNRLSSDFSEWCYYDGTELNFGRPSSSPNIEIAYGADVHNLQLKLRILPLAFSSYSYISAEDKFVSYDAPAEVNGLDEYAHSVLQESNKVFTEPVNTPIRQRIASKSDLEGFVKKRKTTMAADLEVLSGSSSNPFICIGAVADVKVFTKGTESLSKEEYGKFLITGIEHHLSANNQYYNNFEGIPAGIETIPVKSIVMPVAEPQLATVMDNTDPDSQGRVRVQMLWQQPANEMTGWIRVMTPDAGGGRDGAKNRGLVVVPEVGDQVLVCFRYNDPDRPFVMGSLFHGKVGGGGGEGNKSKSLTALSGSTIHMAGDAISIIDAKGNSIVFDGAGKIDVTSSASITLTCGSSKIQMSSDGKIEISGVDVTITGSKKAVMQSTAVFTAGAAVFAKGAVFTAEGAAASVHGVSAEITGEATVDVSAPATTVVGNESLNLTSTGIVSVEGTAMTNVKGGTVNLN